MKSEATGDHLRQIVDSIPALVAYVDRRQRYVFCNREYEEWFGIPAGELAGLFVGEVLGTAVYKRLQPFIDKALAGEKVSCEVEMHHQAKGPRTNSTTLVPCLEDDAGVAGYYVLSTDITDLVTARREAEKQKQEAQESAAVLKALMDYVPEGITIAEGPEVRIGMISSFGAQYTGDNAEELIGTPLTRHPETWQLYHPNGVTPARPEELPLSRATLSGEIIFNEHWLLKKKDGSFSTLLCNAGPIFASGDGTAGGGVIVWRDVTDMKDKEERLERLSLIVEELPDMVASATLDGKILFLNQAALSFLDCDQQGEVTLDTILARMPSWAQDRVLEEGIPTALSQGTWRGESALFDGDRWPVAMNQTIIAHRDEVGNVRFLSTVIRNISAVKEKEARLRNALENLERSNSELEQFASICSHDLQEPLRMISGYTELLQKRYGGRLDEKADRYIHYAVDGTSRMQQLIRDLLQYSRLDKEIPMAPCDMNGVLAQALANLDQMILEERARVTAGSLPEVYGHESQLVRLMQNLISNGIKFGRARSRPHIRISVRRRGRRKWHFWVQDNGIGIPSGDSERVFKIFQRLHGRSTYPGTGVGLAVCKKIVEIHGGSIWCENGPDGGAIFHFTLSEHPLRHDETTKSAPFRQNPHH